MNDLLNDKELVGAGVATVLLLAVFNLLAPYLMRMLRTRDRQFSELQQATKEELSRRIEADRAELDELRKEVRQLIHADRGKEGVILALEQRLESSERVNYTTIEQLGAILMYLAEEYPGALKDVVALQRRIEQEVLDGRAQET